MHVVHTTQADGLPRLELNDFFESLTQLSAANTLEALTAQCRAHSEALGFDSFVHALRLPTQLSQARLVMLDGYPSGWVSHYFAQSFAASDPVMSWCTKHVVPVRWSELRIAPGSQGERMMLEAGDFGLRDGVSMPLHGPHGELGILSIAINRPTAAADAITQRALPFVQMLASHLHEAVRRVAGLHEAQQTVSLTPRESECLRWTADGKTSADIALLLGTSENTVNFHLKNAIQKLEASNRQHAVTRAMLKGLIQPQPF